MSFLAPAVASPGTSSPLGRALSTVFTDDAEVERLLAEEVDKILDRLGQSIRTLGGGGRDRAQELAAQLFLQSNGVSLASESVSSGSGLPASVGADFVDALVNDLTQARTLIRRLDSERRHQRRSALREQRESTSHREDLRALRQDLAESLEQGRAQTARLTAARASLCTAEEEMDALRVEVLRLRRFVRSLPPAFASGLAVMEEDAGRAPEVVTALGLVPDRRFDEAFRDKMGTITYKRRFLRARELHLETAQRLEALSMACEDAAAQGRSLGFTGTAAALAGIGATSAAALSGRAGPHHGLRASTLSGAGLSLRASLSSDAGDVGGSGALTGVPFHLPFSPASPKDDYIRALLHRSQYAEPLNQCREGLLRLSTRLKTCTDKGLRALYAAHLHTLRTCAVGAQVHDVADAKKSFEQQLQKMQAAHRELLFSLVNTVNTAVTDVLEMEKGRRRDSGAATAGGGRGSSAAGGRLTRDVGTMAMDTSMQDYRVHQLEQGLNQQRLRAVEAERARAEAMEQAAVAEQATQLSLQQILTSLETLGRAVVDMARRARRRSVGGREGAAAAAAMVDPFRAEPFSAAAAGTWTDPRLGVKVAEATDLAVSYLRSLSLTGAWEGTPELPTPGPRAHAEEGGERDGEGGHDDAELTSASVTITSPHGRKSSATARARPSRRKVSAAQGMRTVSDSRRGSVGLVNVSRGHGGPSRGSVVKATGKQPKLPRIDSVDSGSPVGITAQPQPPLTPNVANASRPRRSPAPLPLPSSSGNADGHAATAVRDSHSPAGDARGMAVIQLDLCV